MNIKKVRITPQIAEEMLKNNNINRSISKPHVRSLARQMKDGLWKCENGDVLRFSKSGKLLDGQHRLTAIIKSNITLDLFVIYDLDEDVFEFIDAGKSRNGGDVLTIAGVKSGGHISHLISTYFYLKKGMTGRCAVGKTRITNHEILKLYKENVDMYENALKKGRMWNTSFDKVLSASVLGAYYIYLNEKSPKRVDLFFTKLCYGLEFTSKNDPIKVLRDKLMLLKFDKMKQLSHKYIHIYIIKTWNYYLQEKNIKRLTFQENENIPIPLGYIY